MRIRLRRVIAREQWGQGKLTDHEARLKRLHMRSWRRGIKEMDLILGPFADSELTGLGPQDLDIYEDLLNENDQDLYPWITARLKGESGGPERISALLDRIAIFAAERLQKNRAH